MIPYIQWDHGALQLTETLPMDQGQVRRRYKARSIVKRAISILQGPWKILDDERRTRCCIEKIAKVVNVCAALQQTVV